MNNNVIKQIYILIFFLLFQNLYSQEYTDLTLSSAVTTSADYVASNSIRFNAGFSFNAGGTKALSARVASLNVYAPGEGPNGGSGIDMSPVGVINGSFSVNNGGASYSIPIMVSPGTNSMQPSLGLGYSSSVVNGLLGMGWNLSGLSSISRVSSTIYNDGFTKGINLDTTDRFSLDGQRLNVKKGYTYGSQGTVIYKTEVESFDSIVSYGTAGSGPQYFKVFTKSGLTLEFGNTNDSKLRVCRKSEVMLWGINKITDTKGNYTIFKYFKDSINGEIRVTEIDYTGNSAQSLTPYNSITFSYENRSDSIVNYAGGSKLRTSVRLSAIKSYNGTSLLREYDLAYTMDTYSHLISITEKASDGSSLKPTTIQWNNGVSASGSQMSNGLLDTLTKSSYQYFTGDFNGDGLTDILRLSIPNSGLIGGYDTLRFFKSVPLLTGGSQYENSNTEFVPVTGWSQLVTSNYDPGFLQTGDFNGDGLEDFVDVEYDDVSGSNLCYKHISTGTSFSSSVVDPACDYVYSTTADLRTGDFNGDGKTDLVVIQYDNVNGTNGYATVYWGADINNGTPAVFSGIIGKKRNTLTDTVRASIVDFNGDGRADLALTDGSEYQIFGMNENNNFSLLYNGTFASTGQRVLFGDFNGDGKSDMLTWSVSDHWKLKYSTGTGFVNGIAPGLYNSDPDTSSHQNNVFVVDLNGDGKSDILNIRVNQGNIITNAWISNGTGFTAEPTNIATQGSDIRRFSHFGDFDGDGRMDYLFIPYNSYYANFASEVQYHKGEIKHLVDSISNGLVTYNINYNALSDPRAGIYTKGTGASFPVMDFNGPMYVVSSANADNGIGGKNLTTYTYQGAKIHLQGHGFLGFTLATMNNIPANTSVLQYTGYNTTYYYPYTTEVVNAVGTYPAQDVTYTNLTKNITTTSGHSYFPYVSVRIKFLYDNQQIYNQINENFTYDNFGNATVSTTTCGSWITTTTNTYYSSTNFTIGTMTGQLQRSTVNVVNSSDSYTRVTDMAYYTSGQLQTVTAEQGNPKSTTTSYLYDGFGNPVSVKASASGLASRRDSFVYDSKGRFLTDSYDLLNRHTRKVFEPVYGNVTSITDVDNNLITTYTYTTWGQPDKTTGPDGVQSVTALRWCNSGDGSPAGSVYYQYAQASDNAPVKKYFDILGREIYTESTSMTGQIVFTQTVYNALGQVLKSSKPYYRDGGTPDWVSYTYDVKGRALTETGTGISVTNTYNGLTSSSTDNIKSYSKTITTDVVGNMAQSTDFGGTINYGYYASGKTKTITVPGGMVTRMEYDLFGNQTKLFDPDADTVKYTYDAFNQLITQTDRRTTTTMKYDNYGRVVSKKDGTDSVHYTYDTRSRLILESGASSGSSISTRYSYDNYNRLLQETEKVGTDSFRTSYLYDLCGRTSKITYPSGFSVWNIYNQYGYMVDVQRADNGNSVWKAMADNAKGQLTQYVYGNNMATNVTYNSTWDLPSAIQAGSGTNLVAWNYGFNSAGNISSRSDGRLSALNESFGYDNNRLNNININSNAKVLQMTYSANGNISTKTDAGTYNYNASYKPHAVTSVTGSPASPPVINSLTYTSFNKTKAISSTVYALNITYGTGDERIKTVMTQNGAAYKTMYYAGGVYEKEVKPSGTRQLNYIYGGSGLAAVYIMQSTGNKLYYVHTDHLGSITALSDSTGTVVERYSFDAWGNRRNTSDWTQSDTRTSFILSRGFTGHEHLDELGLINMNGRMYSPLLGRFLSPDQEVQDPSGTQSFNRYSYCINNPLMFVDPSGYTWLSQFCNWVGSERIQFSNWMANESRQFGNWCVDHKAFVTTVASIAVAVGVGFATAGMGDLIMAAYITGFAGGAVGGGLGAALSGADAGDIILATIGGGMIGGTMAVVAMGAMNALGAGANSISWLDKTGHIAPYLASAHGYSTVTLGDWFSYVTGVGTQAIADGAGISSGVGGAGLSVATLNQMLSSNASIHGSAQSYEGSATSGGGGTVQSMIKNLMETKKPGTTITSEELINMQPNLSKLKYAVKSIERTQTGFKINRTVAGMLVLPKNAEVNIKEMKWLTGTNKVLQVTTNFEINGTSTIYIHNNAYRRDYSDYTPTYPMWEGAKW